MTLNAPSGFHHSSARASKRAISNGSAVPPAIGEAFLRSLRSMRAVLFVETAPSPMTFAAIPSVEKIGETIVPKPSNLARDRQTQQSGEPCIPGCAQPDLDCTVGAHK